MSTPVLIPARTTSERVNLKAIKVGRGGCDFEIVYSAKVYLDGVFAGVASNDGYGNPDVFEEAAPGMKDAIMQIATECYPDGDPEQDRSPLEAFMHAYRAEDELQKIAQKNANKGLPVTVMFDTDCDLFSYIALPSAKQVEQTAAEHTRCASYRVIEIPVATVEHATLADAARAYPPIPKGTPKSKIPTLFADGTGANPDTITFYANKVMHTFTDESHDPTGPRMYAKFVAERQLQQQAAKAS